MIWHDIAGSITAGCISTIIGHPLDTIKVHQQTQYHLSNQSFIRVAQTLGMNQLWRGIGPPMMNQIIMNTVMFSVFRHVKDMTSSNDETSFLISSQNASAILAGLLSGFATACLSTPTDWFKIQAQLSHQTTATGRVSGGGTSSISLLKNLCRENENQVGKVFQVIYRGHVANLMREGVFTMVYLGLYDILSTLAKEESDKGNDEHALSIMGKIIVISSFTGGLAWVCNYPFDTLKTVMQANRNERISIKNAVQHIWKSGGIKAFYRGIQASTGRAMLVTSTRMLAYETTLNFLS